MLTQVLHWDLVRDPWFFDFGRDALPDPTAIALYQFWGRAEYSEVADGLRLPHQRREQMTDCWMTLLRGRRVGSYDTWQHIARASRDVAASNPVAAAIIALYALAWWEGQLGTRLYQERWPHLPYGLHPSWHLFPLVAAQNLLESNAIWASRRLARTVVGAVENSSGWNGDRNPDVTADCRATLRSVDRRYTECVDNLAWELRESCRTEQPNFRPEVAALFWSLGDVPHANLLRDTLLVPSREVINRLVQRSMQVIHLDPGVQWIWLGLRDRPPFRLREHRELFVSINMVWSDMRSLDLQRGEIEGEHLVDLHSTSEVTPSRAYASAIVEFHASGVTPTTLAQLSDAHLANAGQFGLHAPESLLRLRSLLTLLVDPAELGSGTRSRSELWEILAGFAADIVEARERDRRDAYDRRLDIPFYYVERSYPGSLARALDLTERYRAAGQWYWRYVLAHPAESTKAEARHLLARERQLVEELRSNHFLRLLPFLPQGYGRLVASDFGAGGEGDASHVERDLQRLAEAARDTAQYLAAELDDVAQRLAAIDQCYAAARLPRHATVDDFAALLKPK
ncbi:hypothetical protein [Phytohabitans aurantiacus]|uniref:Uncharacterized protein n=1 Tax=Phytohabitans aurantiacus TaxID=3016789 RepID=A0ABQ5QZ00_9ACTN|nr:hypothetical protein [Phytohabitans aurantiacus]GLH98856.1 hypothetical protein Pa4123_41310 [Phytohabitans aurantiacus]